MSVRTEPLTDLIQQIATSNAESFKSGYTAGYNAGFRAGGAAAKAVVSGKTPEEAFAETYHPEAPQADGNAS